MKLVTSSGMRELDRLAIAAGMPGSVLMENAGRAVAREVLELIRAGVQGPVLVACGIGNNGGDGFVVARHLALAGVPVVVGVAGEPDQIAGDAAANFGLVRSMGLDVRTGNGWLDDLCRSGSAAWRPSLIVDALLGTGTQGEPRGMVADAIAAILRWRAKVVAADVPSGVNADTGGVAGLAVSADVTVTFGYPKPGLLMYPGAECVGRLVVDRIGYDWDGLATSEQQGNEDAAWALEWFDTHRATEVMPERLRDSHKGDYGHVLIVGGSVNMPGAPVLCARGALRSGAGLVTVGTAGCVHAVVASHQPEAMCLRLPDAGGAITSEAMPVLLKTLARASVVCVGPGLSLSPDPQSLVRRLLTETHVPLVADADALAVIAAEPGLVQRREGVTVLTPHPGECSRLLGISTEVVQSDRLAAARDVAERYRCTVALKGARTVVCTPQPDDDAAGAVNLRTAIITQGNPGMATGGSGDVLTGVIGALLAQGLDAYTATCLGVYVHGRAGNLAAEDLGEHGLIAGDIADRVPLAMLELVNERRKEMVGYET